MPDIVELTIAALDRHKRNLGYYKVADEIFYHKISALLSAKQKNTRPTWHFHDEVYRKQDWTKDITESLNDVYRRRAKQLREKYDYLVLSFSGGSDSWTALKAFIDSNTYLDEIFVRWPLKATQGRYQANTQDLHPSNILSEWDFTVLPMLKEIEKIIPQTKITIYDWSDDLIDMEICDDHWSMIDDYLNPGYVPKIRKYSDNEQKIIDAGKVSAMIFGQDKPQMFYKDHGIYCFFLDKLANRRIPGHNRVSELFYWTPDMPEITINQSRRIFRFLESNTQYLGLIDKSNPYHPNDKFVWDQIVRPIIYPDYCRMRTFQAKKSGHSIYDEIDDWMLEHSNLRFMQSWLSGVNNVLQSIGDSFLDRRDGDVTGLNGFVDGVYFLGKIHPISLGQ